mmetsp:Transcript_7264/g.14078  ORF Transcript_7264/g.14078 Transcript_7264/m.14078 type:complete len:447 (+) Transcript_7264:66-1406(+)|eukprot:CAMPEP_0173414896 /NCGR_PEP_ID=MMETSP1356-20130122/84570_1 /TAXON_ID=77927 ORGANISM="Hemiselmis virescens, Strain PCC157" /NCGR_SAMPLE_ID=MMETSP1356 /ASSEMBLY_ACC=CAM_ASM_000847 /LENGTH=446 /DNA_ID=CAMNT_0014377105 /DNA_START=45 /DNA_END=1385 /DNA_ORIENTATION=+
MIASRLRLVAGAGAVVAGGIALSAAASNPAHAEAPSKTGGKKVIVVGGGTGGLGVAAQLKRKQPGLDITIIEPRDEHWYQPMWTMIGGHLGYKASDSKRPMKDIIPAGVSWKQATVASFDPTNNTVVLSTKDKMTYDTLVVAAGLKNDFEKIKGLKQALEDPECPVGTIYDSAYAEKTDKIMSQVKSGPVYFTHPLCPIKCGGAPQKVMWLWESAWRGMGLSKDIDISFVNGNPTMFPVPKYSQALQKMAEEKKVTTTFKTHILEVNGKARTATFQGEDGVKVVKPFAALHVTPYMSPPEVIQKSPLANAAGFIDVDKHTLQHNKFSNVFALGDSAALPTSKTAAAAMSQSPVLVKNLLASLQGDKITASYNGYTSCPILVGDGKLILAEFLYDGKVDETFGTFIDQSKPSRLMYHVKKDFFPWVYFGYCVKGQWYGRNAWFEPKV